MVVPTTGEVKFSDLRNEFGVTGEVKFSDLYRGGNFVRDKAPDGVPAVVAKTTPIANTGTQSLSNFRGTENVLEYESGSSPTMIYPKAIFGTAYNQYPNCVKRFITSGTVARIYYDSGGTGKHELINNGEIQGLSGAGSSSGAGAAGTPAIYAYSPVEITNNGAIRGGGGGGGRGGNGGKGANGVWTPREPVSGTHYDVLNGNINDGNNTSWINSTNLRKAWRFDRTPGPRDDWGTIHWDGIFHSIRHNPSNGVVGDWTYYKGAAVRSVGYAWVERQWIETNSENGWGYWQDAHYTGSNTLYRIHRVKRSTESSFGGNGGTGGAGGRGIGYGTSRTNGSNGTSGSAAVGGNAGAGGAGGKGGDGGNWGAAGGRGSNGAAGGSGSSGSGAAGAGGSSGGAAGAAITGTGHTLKTTGTINGAY